MIDYVVPILCLAMLVLMGVTLLGVLVLVVIDIIRGQL